MIQQRMVPVVNYDQMGTSLRGCIVLSANLASGHWSAMGVKVSRSSVRDDAIDMQGGPPAGFSGAKGGQVSIPSIPMNGDAVSSGRFGAR